MEKSVQELRTEIARLSNELKQRGEDINAPLEEGQIYNLSTGEAEITGFYEEDGVHKVRLILRPFHPDDGCTVIPDREATLSMPIPRFRKLINEFIADQNTREALSKRVTTKHHLSRGQAQ